MLSEALMPSVSALTRQQQDFGVDLTYQQDIGVNFTFNTSLQLTVSSDLVISNLAPNTASDSNIVNVNVSTNAVSGYKLTATVGNNTTYNTRNLVHTNSSLSNTFSSVAYAATPTITANTNLTDNTWAYSYSTDNGSTWANYNGLPLYSDTENFATLKETTGPVSTASGDDIKFKIAAKASETQASGEYNNVINFNLVANPVPVTLSMAFENAEVTKLNGYYKMQDMTQEICDAVEEYGDQLQLIDIRDNKVYWVSKLADDKCWMTQNLDLDLDSNVTLTHADTDLGWGSVIDTTATWTPRYSTTMPNGTIHSWSDFYNAGWGYLPVYGDNLEVASFNPDDLYWSGSLVPNEVIADFEETVDIFSCDVEDWAECAPYNPWAYYNAGVNSGNSHYSLGNYYNHLAAYAKNDKNDFDLNNLFDESDGPYVMENSICPAGWRLPDESNSNNGDFENLLDSYNIGYDHSGSWDNWIVSDGNSSVLALTTSPFYLSLSGSIDREGQTLATGVAQYAFLISNTLHSPDFYNNIASQGLSFDIEYSYNGHSSLFIGIAASIRCIAR